MNVKTGQKYVVEGTEAKEGLIKFNTYRIALARH